MLGFPRIALGGDGVARQVQLVARGGDDIGPALKLFRRAQTRRGPEQVLLFKAKAMLLTVAPPIGGPDLRQGQEFQAEPHEPTDARVPFLAGGPVPDDANDRHRHVATWLVVQVGPGRHFNPLATLVATCQVAVGLPCVRASRHLNGVPSFRGAPRFPVRGGAGR